MFDLAINLSHRFFAAHGENRMAETDQYANKADCVGKRGLVQPSQCASVYSLVINNVVQRWQGRKMSAAHPQRVTAPEHHEHNHDRGHVHDAQSFLARFVDSLNVLPPEIKRAQNSECGCGRVLRQHQFGMCKMQQLVQKSDEILAGRNAADRPGENIIEH